MKMLSFGQVPAMLKYASVLLLSSKVLLNMTGLHQLEQERLPAVHQGQ